MGNTCAQDCAASSTPKGGEVSIDFNAERAHVYAVPAVRHDAKTSSSEADPADLPRLGLGSVLQCFQKPATIVKTTSMAKTPCLDIVFDANGEEKLVRVCRRPLGAEFFQQSKGRTVISKITAGSHAAELGIAPGWSLKSIRGEEMHGKSLDEVQVSLKTGLMLLPSAGL